MERRRDDECRVSIADMKQCLYEQTHPDRMFAQLDGTLTAYGRARVQRWRDAEPPRLSKRRQKKLHTQALALDRQINRWQLEAIDAQLLAYALG